MSVSLAQAVQGHHIVTIWSDGLARTAEPHTYGSTTAGHEALSCNQTAGFSRSTDRPARRLYVLSDIGNLVVKHSPFERTRPGYRSNDSRMTQIFAKA